MRGGRKLKACIPGGSSMPVLPADIMMKTDMDYDSIAKAGSMLGSGAVIVMDETRCMVRSLLRLSYFYFEESCGQCTPCREGTGWLYRMVDRIEHGKGRLEDLDLLNNVADNIQGRTICALGDAAAMPVRASSSISATSSTTTSSTRSAWCRTTCERVIDDRRSDEHPCARDRDRRQADGGARRQHHHGCRQQAQASTFRISAITASSRSPPTAACAWCRWRRRPSRCPRARRR